MRATPFHGEFYMRRNPASIIRGNLPELKRNNLDEVFQTCIDGMNSHIDVIRSSWRGCNAKGASDQEISDSYSTVLESVFSLGEVLGFASGIFYVAGLNIDENLKTLDSKSRGKDWPNPPQGQKHTDIDSIGERWIRLCDVIIRGPDHIGALDGKGVAEQEDYDAKNTETWPKFKDKARLAAAAIAGASIAKKVDAIRPPYSKIKRLEKLASEKKQPSSGDKLTRDDVAVMFKNLCQLKFMIGLINGISYATPSSVTDLKINFPVPGRDAIVIPFADFKVEFEKLTEGANYYGRVTKAIISLMLKFKQSKAKK